MVGLGCWCVVLFLCELLVCGDGRLLRCLGRCFWYCFVWLLLIIVGCWVLCWVGCGRLYWICLGWCWYVVVLYLVGYWSNWVFVVLCCYVGWCVVNVVGFSCCFLVCGILVLVWWFLGGYCWWLIFFVWLFGVVIL